MYAIFPFKKYLVTIVFAYTPNLVIYLKEIFIQKLYK